MTGIVGERLIAVWVTSDFAGEGRDATSLASAAGGGGVEIAAPPTGVIESSQSDDAGFVTICRFLAAIAAAGGGEGEGAPVPYMKLEPSLILTAISRSTWMGGIAINGVPTE